ncbi:DNA adenine methylase [Enterococcus faecium]|nr:DNA adenine methylase [Enterococcus faecium]KST46850.1 DNA adenine methylase [Enterococcus faecium]NRE83774.1 DNA adenine methylase [Enterococcus faecium]
MPKLKENNLKPLFKYPGGKGAEYKHLKKFFPKFNTYVEPFLGGGAVYWATSAQSWIINDYSEELIAIYHFTQIEDKLFLNYINDIGIIWRNKNKYANYITNILKEEVKLDRQQLFTISSELINVTEEIEFSLERLTQLFEESIIRKKKSLVKISKSTTIKNWEENALGILGAGIYTILRELYNHTTFNQEPQLKTALYFFIREYAYSGMFRYNADGMFNVPFGGNTYAKKDFLKRYQQITSKQVVTKLKNTRILRGDFSEAVIDEKDTFMFLDPPYDSEFSTYNLHVFDAQEQVRLRDSLINIRNTKWLMVVKSTDFIEDLYDRAGWYKFHFDKSYSVNFKNRNDQDVKHLVITNYRLENI